MDGNNQLDAGLQVPATQVSSTPAHTPAHNTAPQVNYRPRQPITSTQTEYFPNPLPPQNPTVSAIFGTHRGDQSALFSPLGELPDQENDMRDRGVIQHRQDGNAANKRGYTIYPKPFNGEDFLAFK